MTALELVDQLEQRHMLPPALIIKLRDKAGGTKPITAATLAKFLIEKNLVSQAHLTEIMGSEFEAKPATPTLDLVDDDRPVKKAKKTSASVTADLGGGLDHLDDEKSRSAAAATETKGSKKRGKPRRKSNEWDSPLLLVGGGVLALLVIGSAVIYVILNLESGDKKLAEARAARDNGAYSKAVEGYEEFLETFGTHKESSAARVELAMVRIRRAVEASDFPLAVTTAQQELREVDSEEEFASAELDLTDLLPKIAQGIAADAEDTTAGEESAKLVEQAQQALALCNNTLYLPKERRDDTLLLEVRETLDRVARRQAALDNLAQTISSIRESLAAGDTQSAYEVHGTLIKSYPELTDNEELSTVLAETSSAEKALVKYVEEPLQAAREERPSPIVATLALANQRIEGAAPATGPHVVVAGGAAYAVDATNGKLLWRRYLGPTTQLIEPLTIDSDTLLIDPLRKELLRLDATSGQLRWRLELKEKLMQPVVMGQRIYVATDAKHLHVIDAESGTRLGYVEFPQALCAPPAVDPSGKRIYAAGERASLFTLNASDFACLGSYLSGHLRGTIAAPPVVVVNKLAFVENDGQSTSRLRLLDLDADGVLRQEVGPARLEGLVSQAPIVAGRRFVLVTDRGMLAVYDVNPADGGTALAPLATQSQPGGRNFLRYVLLDDRDIWLASGQLGKFAVAPTGNRFVAQQLRENYQGAQFVGPLASRAGTLLHLRRRAGKAGFTIAATDAKAGTTVWETDIATPPAGNVLALTESATVMVSDANGQVFVFDRDALRSRVQNKALPMSNEVAVPILDAAIATDAGGAAFAASGEQTAIVVDSARRSSATAVALPGTLACEPMPLAEGWLAPLSLGQVHYLDTRAGAPLAAPFQPPVPPNANMAWLAPAVVAGDQPSFVISDGVEKIYHVGLDPDSGSFLTAITEAPVGSAPLSTRLAAIGDRVLAATDQGRVVSYVLPTLEAGEPLDVSSPVVWGPFRVGDIVLLATEQGKLVAVAGDGTLAWTQNVASTDFSGPPCAAADSVIVAFEAGQVVRLAVADGKPLGVIELGQSLVGGPAVLQQQIVVATQDGAIVIANPAQGTSE